MRQAKAMCTSCSSRWSRRSNQIWNLAERVQKVEDVLSAHASQLAAFPQLQDEVRQTKEQLGRLHERALANQGRIEEAMRQQQGAVEREREERSASVRRLEAVEKLAQSYEGRVLAMEEGRAPPSGRCLSPGEAGGELE